MIAVLKGISRVHPLKFVINTNTEIVQAQIASIMIIAPVVLMSWIVIGVVKQANVFKKMTFVLENLLSSVLNQTLLNVVYQLVLIV